MKLAAKQKRNRFSLDLKYEINQLIDKKTAFDLIVHKFQSNAKSEMFKIKEKD